MWEIQIDWNGCWITVETGFKSRDDAEWATAKWKHHNDCRGDPFRAAQAQTPTDPAEFGSVTFLNDGRIGLS